ncbi:MAG: ORF6N domain-containing protein [Bacilli bacterium]|nr:ORF6N domain-containing protein [Bacilli bacterium]
MTEKELTVIELTEQNISSMVYEIRGQKVMLDFDLARIYGYSTKAFNQQVKNNIEKFPEDFMFQLTREEIEKALRSQFVTMKKSSTESEKSLWCQNVTLKNSVIESEESLWSKILTLNKSGNLRGQHIKYLPYAFTEQGIYMLMTGLEG